MNERKKAKKEIEKILKENENKLGMGLIHHLYGPLRGLNFFLQNPNTEEILDIIESQMKPMEMEEMEAIMKTMEKKSKPETPIELNFKVWKYTGLSVQLMVIPKEVLKEAENTPEVYQGIKEAINGVNLSLEMTKGLQEQDVFFFRRGII